MREGSRGEVEMPERKGVEKGGGGEKKRGRKREGVSSAECGVNGRSARLTPY